jgi:hypothetical protein
LPSIILLFPFCERTLGGNRPVSALPDTFSTAFSAVYYGSLTKMTQMQERSLVMSGH